MLRQKKKRKLPNIYEYGGDMASTCPPEWREASSPKSVNGVGFKTNHLIRLDGNEKATEVGGIEDVLAVEGKGELAEAVA